MTCVKIRGTLVSTPQKPEMQSQIADLVILSTWPRPEEVSAPTAAYPPTTRTGFEPLRGPDRIGSVLNDGAEEPMDGCKIAKRQSRKQRAVNVAQDPL
jgi:hypothetical protein